MDFLKHDAQRTHVGSTEHSRQLYVGSPFLKMLPQTADTLLPVFNLANVSSHLLPRIISCTISMIAVLAPSSSNVQPP